MMVLVVVTLMSFTVLYVVMLNKGKGFTKALGENPMSILIANAQTQEGLYYADQSAGYASDQALYDLAKIGGIKGSGCGTYLGYTVWIDREKDCTPLRPDEEFKTVFDPLFGDYLLNYDELYLPLDYDYDIRDMVLLGRARKSIKVDITGLEEVVSTMEPSAKVTEKTAWPASGSAVVTSCFGSRAVDVGSTDHKGVDMRASRGDPVYSVADGEVTATGGDWGMVMIEHQDGRQSKYLHNSKVLVKEGERIDRGQMIARAGNTAPPGYDLAVHIHYELWVDNQPVDPIGKILKIDELDIRFKKGSNCEYNLDRYAYKGEIQGRLVS